MGLIDEILKFHDGLNTELQTNGAPLTSSQALRLMIARAIVGRPRLLLIDGLLDGLSDEALDYVLRRLTPQESPWTLLVTTGRSEVMAACDRVISFSPDGSTQTPQDSALT